MIKKLIEKVRGYISEAMLQEGYKQKIIEKREKGVKYEASTKKNQPTTKYRGVSKKFVKRVLNRNSPLRIEANNMEKRQYRGYWHKYHKSAFKPGKPVMPWE